MKAFKNGTNIVVEIPAGLVTGITTQTDHKGRTSTVLIVAQETASIHESQSLYFPVEKSFAGALLDLLSEQIALSDKEKENKFIKALKADFNATMEFIKNAIKK